MAKRRKAPRRRFTHWTKEKRAALVKAVRAVSIASAARSLGIGESTVADWLTRGRRAGEDELDGIPVKKADRPYVDWAREMDASIGGAEVDGSELILAAAEDVFMEVEKTAPDGTTRTVRKLVKPGDWKARAWWMERRFDGRWGKKRLEITGADGGPLTFQQIQDAMIADGEKAAEFDDVDGGGSLDG